jgi:hypothetical protein
MRFRSFNGIQFLLLWFLLSGAISCSKKDQPASASAASIQNFSLFQGKDITNMDLSRHWISVRVPDTVLSGTTLAANFTITAGASLSVNEQIQQSGLLKIISKRICIIL